jgi:RNA polymerase sigma-70 factor, ECF subfamily
MNSKTKKGRRGQVSLKNPQAFQALYQQSHLRVYRYIFGLLGGSTQDAEDLTAETYMRAWNARYGFRGDEQSALGWLLRIARNLVIDLYRRGKSYGTTSNIDDHILFSRTAGPEERTLIQDQTNLLWERLQELPEDQKEMLTLRYLLGWKVKEIAQFLSLKENTVSVNIRRALQKLRGNWPNE